MSNNIIIQDKFSYTTKSGQELSLTKEIVETYIAGGQKLSNMEYTAFFQLCKEHKVNPFIKEAYCIKYGNSPATIVLDYKVLQQIADSHKHFDGMESGVVVVDKDNEVINRKGQLVLSTDELVGGWCRVYRKDRSKHNTKICMLQEFIQKKRDGTVNKNWSEKPAFMIEKVAKAQALRETFPNSYDSNIYTLDEINTENVVVEIPQENELNPASEGDKIINDYNTQQNLKSSMPTIDM